MTVDISVVVPVYDPGTSIEPCIASLLRQTLAAERFEAIFVDDGSTDDAPARLDRLAAEHPNIRVIHTPNSGWAGRPRNIGIDAAAGRYVQLLDQDDALTPRALELLVATGDRNRSDIVIGKVASDFRTVPLGVFRENRDRCTIADAPLIDSLTPHKAFRTAFLHEHGLRFAEGRRRLEDQLFMVQAYFAATAVSILADELIYRYMGRADKGNTSNTGTTAEGYLGNLREVLDVVVANTGPGEFRDGLLRRFVRVEMLNRLSDRRFSSMDASQRAAWFDATRPLVTDFAGPGVEAGLAPLDQARLRLVRSGDLDGLGDLAERTTPIRAEGVFRSASWVDGRLRLRLACRLVMGDGSAVTVVPRAGGWILHPPLTAGILADPVGWTDETDRPRVSVALHDPPSGEQWGLATRTRPPRPEGGTSRGAAEPLPIDLLATSTADPLTLAAGRPVPAGSWLVQVRIQVAGIDRRATVSVPAAAATSSTVGVVGPDPLVVVAGPAADGSLRLGIEVSRGRAALAAVLAAAQTRMPVRWAPTDGRRLEAELGAASGLDLLPVPVRLTIVGESAHRSVPGTIHRSDRGLRIAVGLPEAIGSPGPVRLELAVGDGSPADDTASVSVIDLGMGEITPNGRLYPSGARRVGTTALVGRRLTGVAVDVLVRFRSVTRRIVLRTLDGVRRRTGITRRDSRLTRNPIGSLAVRVWDGLRG